MLLYSLEWRGWLRYKGQGQMLVESNLSTGYGIKRIRTRDYDLFKGKLPNFSNFGNREPPVKSALCHPKKLHIVKLRKFVHARIFNTRKKESCSAVDYNFYRLQISYLTVTSKSCCVS